ncbi:MAG: hypothetical protein DSZ26_02060 [Thermovibrio sp.]|nr:MAG: hypothetical protein DSZ26_02060 [Thermovibrio sp.]
MVKILDRYVFSEGLKLLFLTLLTFLTIFGIIDFVSHISISMKLGLKSELQFISGRFPLYTVRVLPIAVLISTVVTLSRFSSTSELTVIRALGISTYRFSVPLFVLALLSSLFSLLVHELFVPKGLKVSSEIERKMERASPKEASEVWFKSGSRKFVFIRKLDVKERRGRWGSVIEEENFQPTRRIDGREVFYEGNGVWKFKDVFIRDLNKLKTERLNELSLNLGVDIKDLKSSGTLPEAKSLSELFITIKRLERLGYDTRQFQMELYSKLAISLYSLVVTLIGIPFGVFNPRNRKGYTVLIVSTLIVLMWVTTSLFISLGKSGALPPIYASFAPLILFTSLGLILFGRVET